MGRPRYFAILASMRTGSNLLQRTLNQFPDLICHGELFNPAFVEAPGQAAAFGLDRAARDRDPLALIERMVAAAGDRIPGFRIFDGHDPRVLQHVARDPACARVLLTRPAEESFVSLMIARETGQWLLTDPGRRRSARVTVDPAALAAHRAGLQAFHDGLSRAMRLAGQAAFPVTHAELGDAGLINGLAAHLGSRHRLRAIAPTLVRQNPGPLAAHVTNPEVLQAPVSPLPRIDPRGFLRAGPVLVAPIPGVPGAPDFAAAFGPVETGLGRARLQALAAEGRIGSVVALLGDPFVRVHAAFRDRIALPQGEGFPRIRAALVRDHGLVLPEPGAPWSLEAHRTAFAGFLRFLADNLAGRTAIRIDPVWAPQVDILKAIGAVLPPTLVVRPGQGAAAGRYLRDLHGLAPGDPAEETGEGAFPAALVRTPDLAGAVRALYPEDHALAGQAAWDAAGSVRMA